MVTIQTIALKNAFNDKTRYSTCELDQHADTCCLGSNFLLIHDTQRRCSVMPYNAKYDPLPDVKVISGATAYTHPDSNLTYILWIHEALYFGTTMEHSLLNPNQLRHNGVLIQDNPYHPRKNMNIEAYTANDEEIFIPLFSKGVDIYFESRTPTSHELDSCPHVHLTNVNQEWNPAEIVFPNGNKKKNDIRLQQVIMCSALSKSIFDINHFYFKISQLSCDNTITYNTNHSFISDKRHGLVTAEELSAKWMIGPKQALLTLKNTTQRGVRSALFPLSRRYRGDLFLSKTASFW